MKMLFITILTIQSVLFLPSLLLAQVALSEVLYNEPGARVGLEWVEIYNRADTAVNLGHYHFISGIDTTIFPPGANVPSKSYAVLAKHLVASDSMGSFEGHWGDSSGFWGDSPIENYRAFPARMNLLNNSGAVHLINMVSQDTDQCIWNGPAADGQSWERDAIDPPSETWHLSTDSSGSTPGRANSERAMAAYNESIQLSSRMLSSSNGEKIQIDYAVPVACEITLEIFDDSGRKQSTLVEKSFLSGQVSWDGKAGDGSPLAPGIYLLVSTLLGNQNGAKYIPVVVAP